MSNNPFAIVVTVRVKPGKGSELMPFILDNAASAVRDEPGCQQFQILADETDADTLIFYEVYDNAQALESHRRQPHFLKFAEASEGRIIDKSIRRCTVIKT